MTTTGRTVQTPGSALIAGAMVVALKRDLAHAAPVVRVENGFLITAPVPVKDLRPRAHGPGRPGTGVRAA